MLSLTPSWDLCVVSYEIDKSQIRTLTNAFLYGDRVLFIPVKGPMLATSVLRTLTLVESKSLQEMMSPVVKKGLSMEGLSAAITRRQRALDKIVEFINEIDRIGLPRISVDTLGSAEVDLYKRLVLKHVLTEAMLSGLQAKQFDWETVLSAVEDEYVNSEEATNVISGNNEVMEEIGRCYGCYIDSRSPRGYRIQAPPKWSTHRAADFLTRAAHKVLLPDISDVPLAEVMSLRDRLHDELGPMRAELLRLSNHLRKAIQDGAEEDEMHLEAENIIATHVEPVIFEVAKHTRDEMKSRLKKHVRKVTSVIALAGFGILFPSLTKDAIKQGIDAVGSIGLPESSSSNLGLGTATARFMLELRRIKQNT